MHKGLFYKCHGRIYKDTIGQKTIIRIPNIKYFVFSNIIHNFAP